jgi:hypothetical protein
MRRMKRLFKKGMAMLLGILLTSAAVFTADTMPVNAAATTGKAEFNFAADSEVSCNSMNLEYTWYSDASGSTQLNAGVVSLKPNSTDNEYSKSETVTIPDTAASVKIKVQTAGNQLKASASSINKNGASIGNILGVTGDNGILIELTKNDKLDVNIQIEKTPTNNQTPGNGGGGGGTLTNPVTLSFNVSAPVRPYVGVEEIIVDESNGNRRATVDSNSNTASVQVESAATHTLSLIAYHGSKITAATVDGASCTIDGNNAKITVSEKTNAAYVVDVTATESDDVTILWTHDPAEKNGGWSDAYIEKGTGTVEFVKLERNGAEVQPGSQSYTNENGGYYQCKRGDVATLKFVPAPGYQLTNASLNGSTLEPQEQQCVFKVTMNSNFHLAGAFTKTDVQTSVSGSSTVTGLSASGTDAAVSTGNVAIGVTGGKSNPSDSAIETAMGNNSSSFVGAVETIDITMTNVISKGGNGDYFSNSNNYWTNRMTTLPSPATLSLNVENKLAEGETYGVVRNHDSKLTELDATYNTETGKLTFSSDGFSDYTIIKKKGTPSTDPAPAEEEKKSSGSSEDSTPQAAAPAILGTVTSGSGSANIKSWTELNNVFKKTPATTDATGKKVATPLVQLSLNQNNATVPGDVFANLAGSSSAGLHIFTGNGVAVTFANTPGVATQGPVNLKSKVTRTPGRTTIAFVGNTTFKTTTAIHAVVPAGTKVAYLTYTSPLNVKSTIIPLKPDEAGRVAFLAVGLGTFDITY